MFSRLRHLARPAAAAAAACTTLVVAATTTTTTVSYLLADPSDTSSDTSNIVKENNNRPQHYVVVAAEGQEHLAESLQKKWPKHFLYCPTSWGRFADNTDNILVGGYGNAKKNEPDLIRGSNVLFLASFSSNDTVWSQINVLTMLGESFVDSLTIVLPFFPNGTMERVVEEGRVATANTCAKVLSHLPRGGSSQNRLIMYDLHTLQNRFYFDGNTLAQCPTAFPLCVDRLRELIRDDPDGAEWCVAFPDDGAGKRFGHHFKEHFPGMELIVCGKKRDPMNPKKREVKILDGCPAGKKVLIIDDIVNSGGTLYKTAIELKTQGAISVSAYCTHAVFPKQCWRRFAQGGDRSVFEKFLTTNTNPSVSRQLPLDDCFEVLDISPLVAKDVLN